MKVTFDFKGKVMMQKMPEQVPINDTAIVVEPAVNIS